MFDSALNSNNYLLVDKRLIKSLGPQTAVYLSHIISNADNTGSFDINCYKEIGLNKSDSDSLLKRLVTAGILLQHDRSYKINLNVIYSIITGNTVPTMLNKYEDKDLHNSYIVTNIKKSITETDEDLRKSLELWIDTIFQSSGMTSANVKYFQEKLKKFTEDKKAKLSIINIATVKGYRNGDWAIRDFTKTQLLENNSSIVINPILSSDNTY